jgi:hypothetical protein
MDEPLAVAIALLNSLDYEAKVRLLREILWLCPEFEQMLRASGQKTEPENEK